MPYIEMELRKRYTVLNDVVPLSTGELNFCITTLLNNYIKENGVGYSSINEVIGALECAKLELYRRVAAPYEKGKQFMNGDVYKTRPLSELLK